jgi:hypothetical protein
VVRSFPNIERLTKKAQGLLPLFLNTLQDKYIYPKFITSKNIESGLRLSGAEVRAIVRSLRRAGHLVVSTGKGYSYTNDDRIFESTTLPHLKDRRNSIDKTIRDIEHAIYVRRHTKTPNQIGIF